MHESILLIEDEEGLRMTLTDRLQSEGYVVTSACDGEEGLEIAARLPLDLIVLDLMLPRKSGFDVCRDLRQAGLITPVLMLTARGHTVDKVIGLKLGADDYLTKPFDMLELTARIEAVLRRAPTRPSGPAMIRQIGPLRVDVRATEVTRDGKIVPLSAREFQLLRYFLEHRGATLSRDEILKEVWGYSAATFTRTVDVHVASLRQKLEKDPKKPELTLTVLGLGYKFAS
jgi:two-component system, OmpR family, alkaline phosphatase synthesis response regulator PhoP